MLFFIDETWQTSPDGKQQVGILAAVSIKSTDFNRCSRDIFSIRVKSQGLAAAQKELKGRGILGSYVFKLESDGVPSRDLKLAEEILKYVSSEIKMTSFGSIVSDKKEIDLECTDVNVLERPFLFLFERINLFMEENYPDLTAKLIFDDRSLQTNQRISKAVSNFLHKSRAGKSFERIVKVPFFAISNENIGIQLADITAYILGKRNVGDPKFRKYYDLINIMRFKSKKLFPGLDGKMYPLYGFKELKDRKENSKEAGDK